jgi:hypothetical protein
MFKSLNKTSHFWLRKICWNSNYSNKSSNKEKTLKCFRRRTIRYCNRLKVSWTFPRDVCLTNWLSFSRETFMTLLLSFSLLSCFEWRSIRIKWWSTMLRFSVLLMRNLLVLINYSKSLSILGRLITCCLLMSPMCLFWL